MIQRVRVLDALLTKPADNFVIGYQHRTGAFQDSERVSYVVLVTVRDQDVVGMDAFNVNPLGRLLDQRVGGNKGVEEYCFTGNFNGKTRVAVEGKVRHGWYGYVVSRLFFSGRKKAAGLCPTALCKMRSVATLDYSGFSVFFSAGLGVGT